MAEELPAWGQVQKRTFTRWCNVHLSERKFKIEDLAKDFEDGIKLINLLEVISGKKIPYQKHVKFYSQKLENVSIAFKFLKDEGLRLVAIGPEDIVEKRIKLILGVIWTIILRYQIQKVDYTQPDPPPKASSASTTPTPSAGDVVVKVAKKETPSNFDLLKWVNTALPEFKIKNFKGDWKDGKALYALTFYLRPGVVDIGASDKLSPLERATKASEAATTHLAIPPILDPVDLVSDNVDDLSTMTYVSMFRDYAFKARRVEVPHCEVKWNRDVPAKAGEDNTFVIHAKNMFGDSVRQGGDTFEVQVTPTNTPSEAYTVDIHDNNDGTYTVHYTPTSPGEIKIEVSFRGIPLPNTPFYVTAEKVIYSADPSHTVIVSGPTLEADGLTHFVVATHDKKGRPLTVGGADFHVSVKNPTDGTEAHVQVRDKEDGTYTISIAPPKDAEYDVKIGLQGTGPADLISGGAFVVKLAPPVVKPKEVDPKDISVLISHLGKGEGTKPDPDGFVSFVIKPRNVSADQNLSATNFDVPIKSPDGIMINPKIHATETGLFVVQFKPTESGLYEINVALVDTTGKKANVPGGPYVAEITVPPTKVSRAVQKAADTLQVDLTPLATPPDEDGLVYVILLPEDLPENTQIEPKVTFVANNEPLKAEVTKNTDGTASVSFKPEKNGEYQFDVDLIDENGFSAKVKGTPLKVRLEVEKPVIVDVSKEEPHEDIIKAAQASKVDLEPLREGPDVDGNFGFVVHLPDDVPEDSKVVAKLTYLPENIELPVSVKSKPDGDLGVSFKPPKSGDYLLEGYVTDKEGRKAKLSGTPVRLDLSFPERGPAEPAVQQAAQDVAVDFSGLSAEGRPDGAVSFNIGARDTTLPEGAVYEAQIVHLNENAVVDSQIEENPDGTFGVVFYPNHEEGPAEYKILLNLLDKQKNPAKVSGGPWRVIVDIVKTSGSPHDVNPLLRSIANDASIDMSPMNDGPNEDGDFHYDINNLRNLPDGSHLDSKITLTADGSDIKSKLKAHSKGGYSVFFKPLLTGAYLIEAVLVDKKDMGVSIKGTPLRLNLNLGNAAAPSTDEPEPEVVTAAENSSLNLLKLNDGFNEDGLLEYVIDTPGSLPEGTTVDTKVVFVPDNLDLPWIIKPLEAGAFGVAFKPAQSGEYMIAANLVDKNGKSARVKGTPAKLLLTLPDIADISPYPEGEADAAAMKAAENSSLDLQRLNDGFNDDGRLEFDVNTDTIPEGAKFETSVTYTPDNFECLCEVKPLGGGRYGVAFEPTRSGEYIIKAYIVDKDGKGAKINGTPTKLNLDLPDPEPAPQPAELTGTPDAAVAKAAANSTLNLEKLGHGFTPNGRLEFDIDTKDVPEGITLETTVRYIPENLDLPCELKSLGNGKYTAAFEPSRSGEYVITANLVDKNGNLAKLKGTPTKLNLTLPDRKPPAKIGASVGQSTSTAPLVPVASSSSSSSSGAGSGNGTGTIGSGLAAGAAAVGNESHAPWKSASSIGSHKSANVGPSLQHTAPASVGPSSAAAASDSALAKAAEYTTVALQKLNAGLNADGRLEYEIDTRYLPEGAKVDTKVIFVPDSLDLPCNVKALGGGKFGVAFKPSRGGEYLITVNLNDKDGKWVKVKGTPIKLSLTLPEPIPEPLPDSQPHEHARILSEDETDEAHTIMWTHSFIIEAHTIKGIPKVKGGDHFEVVIRGPNGPVPDVSVKDLGTGKYLVTYTLPGLGEFHIRATINGRNIVGSPFLQRL